MSGGPVGVAIVGAGVISGEYLRTLSRCPDVQVLGIADIDLDRAEAAAREHGVAVAGSVERVLELDEVEIVVNLTVPAAHVAVCEVALDADKHVYVEKPLALEAADGARLLKQAAARGLRVGCAPDTFLGPVIQTARRAIDAGEIGEPLFAATAALYLGPEVWHPRPEFLFRRGAGPLFDIGPYHLTALVALLGPVAAVTATARASSPTRTIGSGPLAGKIFDVEVPTHVAALLELRAGGGATTVLSFDAPVREARFDIAGTEGTLALSDPNSHVGAVRLHRRGAEDGLELDTAGPDARRGVGVVDLARALRAGTPHRASGALGGHVLDVMAAIAHSASERQFVSVESACPDVDPLPAAWDPSAATLR
jgi:predicted dehydrogenase